MSDIQAGTLCGLCGREHATERVLGTVAVGARCRAWLLDKTSGQVAYNVGLTDRPPPPEPTVAEVVRLASAVARRHSPAGRVPRTIRAPVRIVTAPLWVPIRFAKRTWRRSRR